MPRWRRRSWRPSPAMPSADPSMAPACASCRATRRSACAVPRRWSCTRRDATRLVESSGAARDEGAARRAPHALRHRPERGPRDQRHARAVMLAPHGPNRVVRFLRVLGPGLVTGASDDDPSGITTYSVAGASFGYATLWTPVLTLPLTVPVQLPCARIGLVTRQGLAGFVRPPCPPTLPHLTLPLRLSPPAASRQLIQHRSRPQRGGRRGHAAHGTAADRVRARRRHGHRCRDDLDVVRHLRGVPEVVDRGALHIHPRRVSRETGLV